MDGIGIHWDEVLEVPKLFSHGLKRQSPMAYVRSCETCVLEVMG